ncbi:MAG TPA: Gfo/Idh/MocA family oxidoreductase [Saprospiraceae bacterium]|nr:Gfo/Idh/MocA family oxidoreductase [Saprospiraceae bacterium]
MSKINSSRRKFLKTGTILTGGAMLSGLPLAQAAQSLVDDTIKIALVGCGGRGTGAAVQALLTKQNVKLVAMADAFRSKIDEAYKNITADDLQDIIGVEGSVKSRVDVPEDRKFVGFDAYKKAIALADVVILTTPPGFRPTHFEEAVKRGKQIFMEKPVAVDGPGIRKVLAAAEEAKRKKLNVVVGLQRHYQNVYRQWIDRLQNGAIGEIITSRVYWNMGALWIHPRKKGQTEMEYQMDNWYYFNWLCGDHIVEQHVHNLDVSNWAKQAYPVKAYGSGGRQVRIGPETGEIFDHHTVEFEYADGSRMFSQCRQIPGTKDSVTEGFHGTKGTAPSPGLILKKGKEIMNYQSKNDPNPYQVEHDELFAAIAKGEYKFADAENAAKSTLTAIMGRMATYSGQIVDWNTALNSQVNLMPEMLDWNANPRVLPGPDGIYPCAVPGVFKVM